MCHLGAGFIGSHVVERLVEAYSQYKARCLVGVGLRVAFRVTLLRTSSLSPSSQVVVIDRLDYCANMRNLNAVKAAPNYKVGLLLSKCH